jgi:hypothetical protein
METPNLPAIPDDLRKELLSEQADQIGPHLDLPRLKIMPAAAGLFEFSDTQDTLREFSGVVLNSHGRNVLWPHPYGHVLAPDEPSGPACVSGDGTTGSPREGYTHAGLGGTADGTEQMACGVCPYNQWGSASIIGKSGAGKACTNQRSVYIMVEGRGLPYEMVLPPTSLNEFDAYLTMLTNQGVPAQAVLTEFSQEKVERGTIAWSVAKFTMGDVLSDEAFALVRERRAKFLDAISPRAPIAEADWYGEGEDDEEGENTPF